MRVYSMENFCSVPPPVHASAADFIGGNGGDVWRTCGYLRSPSPGGAASSVMARDDVRASLRAHQTLDDDGRQSADACIDLYYSHQHQQQQQQQLQRAPSPIDDLSNEPMFSFSARAQSKPYKYASAAYRQ